VKGVIDALGALDGLLMEMEKVDQDKNTMMDLLSDISAVSQESAAGTQQISATVEEQAGMIEEIAKMSEELSEIVNELNKEVKKFKF
jgi:methyl-accepting chemotaxis protein